MDDFRNGDAAGMQAGEDAPSCSRPTELREALIGFQAIVATVRREHLTDVDCTALRTLLDELISLRRSTSNIG